MAAAFGLSEALLDAQQSRGNTRRAALARASAEELEGVGFRLEGG
ncbi:MAG: hypothetical protein SH809_14265 [Rhodothermales bacterium]|nr:hypothetical protein [Rhodothermales bacterium]